MAREIIWQSIPPSIRHRVVVGESHRFRVWQAIKQLGDTATAADLLKFTGFSRSTVYRHAKSIGYTPKNEGHNTELELLPCDTFMQIRDRPSRRVHE